MLYKNLFDSLKNTLVRTLSLKHFDVIVSYKNLFDSLKNTLVNHALMGVTIPIRKSE